MALLDHIVVSGCPGGSVIKNLPASAGDLGQGDPLVKIMANHSNIPAWEIPWAEEPGRLQSMDWTQLND